jgi:hypothetical protein
MKARVWIACLVVVVIGAAAVAWIMRPVAQEGDIVVNEYIDPDDLEGRIERLERMLGVPVPNAP